MVTLKRNEIMLQPTTESLGLSIFSQFGIWPFVTIKIFRTHGANFSTDRKEYLFVEK